jgi:cytochrome c551/c552
VNELNLNIKGVKVSDDKMKVRIVIDNLRQYYLHELNLSGIRSEDGVALLHPLAYYTLNNIQSGEKLKVGEYSTKRTVVNTTTKKVAVAASKSTTTITYAEVEPLLAKNTCTACHNVTKRQVGPAFVDIAKRKYTIEKIMDLIYNPQPKNWPESATPKAAMPQVPTEDARKIAIWITSLAEQKP